MPVYTLADERKKENPGLSNLDKRSKRLEQLNTYIAGIIGYGFIILSGEILFGLLPR